MVEGYIQLLSTFEATTEDIAGTRERLKDRFPRGSTRRMTQLGMLIGAALDDLSPRADDCVVYASAFAETRALEGYLDSFPSASPTLFQTSIHPSAVQQALITRQHPVGEFFPLTGRSHLVGHALQTALLSPAPRALFCGGEERGSWLLERGIASDRTFAFALALTQDANGAIGRIALDRAAEEDSAIKFTLPELFDALTAHRSVECIAAPGTRLTLQWC
jgi:hypothetical protein